MIVLFTDFGHADSYVGQLHGVLAREAPGVPVIDLFHSVPKFQIQVAAYLLPAYVSDFSINTIFVCVVDPGVGGQRKPLVARIDGRWFVGPDNGLFSILMRRAKNVETWRIIWRPDRLSESFHGRDLFAPVAARLALEADVQKEPTEPLMPDWPTDLMQVLYIDQYGNGITGIREQTLATHKRLRVGRHVIKYARVFGDARRGRPFWYVNANGLVEIAMREDSASAHMRLRVGMSVKPATQTRKS